MSETRRGADQTGIQRRVVLARGERELRGHPRGIHVAIQSHVRARVRHREQIPNGRSYHQPVSHAGQQIAQGILPRRVGDG